jgi:aldose 1-epimerase
MTTAVYDLEVHMGEIPSGEQFEIVSGEHRATVVEVGGGVRAYEVAGRPVLEPYSIDAIADGGHGAPLIPWPNRLDQGRYRFDGVDRQLPLTEPDKNNAIHGLLRWRSWTPREYDGDRVVMGILLRPMPGYPFTLDVAIEYRVGGAGLTARTTATNRGDAPLPYGCGQHPYLSPGAGRIDECRVWLDAATRIATDAQRQLPTGREPVEGTEFDLRAGRRLGALEIDYAYTDLRRDDDGRAWARMDRPHDGRTVALWVDEAYPYLQIFTGDTLAPHRRRTGLGCEPMSCPPNAFATGERVIRLEPGQTTTATWGASLA